MFDALKYNRALEKAGLSREQAEIFIGMQMGLFEKVATKKDLEKLEITINKDFERFKMDINKDFEAFKVEIRKDFEAFKMEIRNDIESLRNEMFQEMRNLEQRMTIKLGSIMALSIGLMQILNRLF